MFIVFEGIDGVGKTSLAQKLSHQLNYKFIETPLSELMFNNPQIYAKVVDYIHSYLPGFLRAWFYSFSNLYLSEKYCQEHSTNQRNLITNRYVVSNFAYNSDNYTGNFFANLFQFLAKPDLTIYLTADLETIKQRISNRNKDDKDLLQVEYNKNVREPLMLNFLKQNYNAKQVAIINTTNLNLDEVYKKIMDKIQKIQKIQKI